jgi:hypothetical protein
MILIGRVTERDGPCLYVEWPARDGCISFRPGVEPRGEPGDAVTIELGDGERPEATWVIIGDGAVYDRDDVYV